LRFADVTACVARVQQHMEGQQLAFRLDGAIRHLLLDEFQDTSPLQWRALRPLARRVLEEGSFFCVGDGKQAIYGWRGGVAEILDTLPRELAPLRETTLDVSYRCSQPVIDAVNMVFQNLVSHPNLDDLAEPLAKWQAAFPTHKTARAHLPGLVQLRTGPEAPEGEDPLAAILNDTAQRVDEWRRRAPWAKIAVLMRTNDAVAQAIYFLRQSQIPASEEGGNPLVDSPAVELILSLLLLADHPGDRVARFHLAHSPLAGALGELVARERREADAAAPPFQEKDDWAASLLSRALRRQLLEEGYGPTVLAWARRLAPACTARQRLRLEQLVEQAYAYQAQSTLRPSDFVRRIERSRVADPLAAPVRVMTIHQAKGLEFDVVLLPELSVPLIGQPPKVAAGRPAPTEPVDRVCRLVNETVRSVLPEEWQALFAEDRAREATESLCLLYVAMTRAVHVLEMIIPPARKNERSLPKTFAGLLRATLAPHQPAKPQTVLYTHGDPQWDQKPLPRQTAAGDLAPEKSESTSESAASSGRADTVPSVLLAPAPAGAGRNLKRVSPSMLEGGRVLRGAALLASRPKAALDSGTLWHAWLAHIAWLEDGLPDDATLEALAERHAGELGALRGNLADWIRQFRQMLAQPAVAALLSRTFYRTPAWLELPEAVVGWPEGPSVPLELFREWSFALRRNDELISGAIDRLVLVRQGDAVLAADVIDFKTDVLPTNAWAHGALARRRDYYRPQVEAYREVVARTWALPLERVSARLVFLQAGKVVPLRRADAANRA
jgi:ATP-dependent exoDNAse (exonuclease V) beta subunit